MDAFVNVLEEIIVREIYIQIEELRPDMQPKIKVAEVTAYALNRLPPLFATSRNGWKHQYEYALNELQPQIVQLIRSGFKTVLFGDPLHDITPLPNHLFANNAGVLHQLSKLLGRKYLRWRDIPSLIEEIISRSSCQTKISNQTVIQSNEQTEIQHPRYLSASQRELLSRSKRFVEKQLVQKQQEALRLSAGFAEGAYGRLPDGSWSNDKKVRDAMEMEYKALDAYTLQAQLGLINVLEHLVLLAIERFTTPEIYRQINRGEVAAYALNQLPPMYATSVRGFRHLRQRAINEFSRELIGSVRTGVMKVLKLSQTTPPIYAYQFMQEYEKSILHLSTLLARDDISLLNIVPIVKDLLEPAHCICCSSFDGGTGS
jgi:hypothetical protein